MQGARIVEECPVTDVLHKGGVVSGVRTAFGDI
jgi:glycine/D-amino acid oxidase-like deaminating enzyme